MVNLLLSTVNNNKLEEKGQISLIRNVQFLEVINLSCCSHFSQSLYFINLQLHQFNPKIPEEHELLTITSKAVFE